MGEVYRARDERLKRTVALKALRGALATDDLARRRFVRETRLACKVVHPYVATVFDVAEHEGNLFLIMEYIEGRRLDQVLQRDAPTQQELARYGMEIAEALAAIHREGLVHRDLKPGNVMVTPAGHVKVMDFGVARTFISGEFPTLDGHPSEYEATLTEAGLGVGTVLYMSPEQVRSDRVDHRSDLFALGTILYEAITGEHPFSRGSVLETASAILNEPPGGGDEPRSLTQSGPLRNVVMRLLEKDAADRYQDAETVVGELQAVLEGRALGVPGWPLRRTRVWRVLLPVALAVVLLGAAVGVWMWLKPEPIGGPAGGREVVAVLPFVDDTGENADTLRGEMIASLLSAELAGSREVRSLGDERVREVLNGLPADSPSSEEIRRFHQTTPARWVLSGKLFRDGDAYQATVEVYQAGFVGPFGSFRVGAARITGLVDRISTQLVALLAPDASGAPEVDEARLSTYSEEARLLDFRAAQALREYRVADAIDLAERAIAIAPDFLEAEGRLAVALHSAGYGSRAREAAQKARRLAERSGPRVSEYTRLRVLALAAEVTDEITALIDLRRRLAEGYPDDPGILISLAVALREGAKLDEALDNIEKAIAQDDRDPRSHLHKAKILSILGDQARARLSLDQAERLFNELGSREGLALVDHERGHIDRRQGDYEAAIAAYEAAAGSYRQVGLEVAAAIAESNIADVEILMGRLASAEARLSSALAMMRAAGNSRLVVQDLDSLGASLYVRGEIEKGESYLRDALTEGRELDNPRIILSPKINLASLLCYSGSVGEGSALAEEALTIARARQDRQREIMALTLLADAHFQLGKTREAIDAYRDLLRLQEAPGGATESLGWAHAGLSEVLQATGALARSLDAANRSVEAASSLGQRVMEGYTRLRRAMVLAELGDWPGAEDDLAKARAFAGQGADALKDLHARVELTRGTLSLMRGDFREAQPYLDEAERLGAEAGLSDVLVLARTAKSGLALRAGDVERAEREARTAVAMKRSRAPDRTAARAALAEALARAGKTVEAVKEGRRAFEEAERVGMPRIVATAAATLVSVPRPDRPLEEDEIRETGREALRRLRDSLAGERLASFVSRPDLREVAERLEFLEEWGEAVRPPDTPEEGGR